MRIILSSFIFSCISVLAGNVTTQGQGSVIVVPDMAHISTELHSEDSSASGALQRVQQRSSQLIVALTGLGINESDIATNSLNLYPSQEWRDGQVVREFFAASHRLSVKVRDLDSVGTVMDLIANLSGNNAINLSLDVADRSPANQQALALAMSDARKKAEILAGAEDLVLGAIQEINSHMSQSVSSQRVETTVFDTTASGIAPGEFAISAFVTVAYELAP